MLAEATRFHLSTRMEDPTSESTRQIVVDPSDVGDFMQNAYSRTGDPMVLPRTDN